MAGAILILVLTLGAVVQAHNHKSRKHNNEYSTEREYSAAATAYNFEKSEMEFIQSVLAKLSAMKKDDKSGEAISGRSSGSDEDKSSLKIGVADTLDSDEQNIGRSGAENDSNPKQNILEYLSKMLNQHRHENQRNRRLDIEDNGDDFFDLDDIDNPESNDYNQDEVQFKSNRNNMGYEALLDMKGRSGFDGSVQRTNIFNDRTLYRTPLSRRGLFVTPGFYHYPTPPSITFNKIDSRDLLHPMGLLNKLPFRRLEQQIGEVPTEAITKSEDPLTRSEGSSTWNADENAYQYEPEEEGLISTPSWNYGR